MWGRGEMEQGGTGYSRTHVTLSPYVLQSAKGTWHCGGGGAETGKASRSWGRGMRRRWTRRGKHHPGGREAAAVSEDVGAQGACGWRSEG